MEQNPLLKPEKGGTISADKSFAKGDNEAKQTELEGDSGWISSAADLGASLGKPVLCFVSWFYSWEGVILLTHIARSQGPMLSYTLQKVILWTTAAVISQKLHTCREAENGEK